MGEAAALTSALCWAAAGVAVTSLSARLPAAALSALQMTIGSAALLLAMVVSGQLDDLADAGLATLLAVAGTGVIGFAIADPIYVRALSIVGMQRTYPVTIGLFILLSTFGGVALLGERFTLGLLLGGALIVGGTYLVLFRSATATAATAATEATAATTATAAEATREPAFAIGGAVQAAGAHAVPRARSRSLEGYVLLAVVPVLWAIASLWLAGARGELGAIPAAALRVPTGTFLLVGFLLATRPRDLQYAVARRRDVAAIAFAGLAGIALASLLYVYALIEAGAARSAVLSASSPLFAIPLAIVFLREPLTRRVLTGTAVSVSGIVVVVAL